jgi:hypothetical protein
MEGPTSDKIHYADLTPSISPKSSYVKNGLRSRPARWLFVKQLPLFHQVAGAFPPEPHCLFGKGELLMRHEQAVHAP